MGIANISFKGLAWRIVRSDTCAGDVVGFAIKVFAQSPARL